MGKFPYFFYSFWLTTLARQRVRLCVLNMCSNAWYICFVFIFTHTEKGFGEHQCPFGLGHEIRQILLGLQANLENIASRQSQIDHHRQQHTTTKVKHRQHLYWLLRSSVFLLNLLAKPIRVDSIHFWNHMESPHCPMCDWEVCFQNVGNKSAFA